MTAGRGGKLPTIGELAELIVAVKADIGDEYRAYPDDDAPGILLTIGWNDATGRWSEGVRGDRRGSPLSGSGSPRLCRSVALMRRLTPRVEGVQLHRIGFRHAPSLSYDTLTDNGKDIYNMLADRYGLHAPKEDEDNA